MQLVGVVAVLGLVLVLLVLLAVLILLILLIILLILIHDTYLLFHTTCFCGRFITHSHSIPGKNNSIRQQILYLNIAHKHRM